MTAAEKHINKRQLQSFKNTNRGRHTYSMQVGSINQSPLAGIAHKESPVKQVDDLPKLNNKSDSRFRIPTEVSKTKHTSPDHKEWSQERIKKSNLIANVPVSSKSIASSVTNF